MLVLTFGTGIGSAVLRGGKLEPNTELGQLHVDGEIADGYASLSALRSERLPWPEWIGQANRFLQVVEEHDHYDLIVIGGGLTHEAEHWEGQLVTRAPLRQARFFNRAGVVGAAMAAEHGIHGCSGGERSGAESRPPAWHMPRPARRACRSGRAADRGCRLGSSAAGRKST